MARDLPPIPPDNPHRRRQPERLGHGNDRPPDRSKRVNPFDEFEAANPEYFTGDLDTLDAELDNDPDSNADDPGTGWYARAVRYNPDRPDPEAIHLTDERRTHILDGDAEGMGGGHRHGTGRPSKTEFPADWTDEQTAARIQDVARNPDRTPEHRPNGRWKVQGQREAVDIIAIVTPQAQIWTAYPKSGGPGVVKNPKGGRK